MSDNGAEPLTFSGMVIDGVCDRCDKVGAVGVVFAGPQEERLTFLCSECGKAAGLGKRIS